MDFITKGEVQQTISFDKVSFNTPSNCSARMISKRDFILNVIIEMF